MFFHVAGLYVTLHAEFLAAVQIVVYAGAILVLYLFVVMLLNVKTEERYHNQLPVAGLLGVMLCTEVILLLIQLSNSDASARTISGRRGRRTPAIPKRSARSSIPPTCFRSKSPPSFCWSR